MPDQPSPTWSASVTGAIVSLALARETGFALIRDDGGCLTLISDTGTRQGQYRGQRELTASSCSDDGSAFIAGSKDGELTWLGRDLMPRWQQMLERRIEAVAVDPLGCHVAAASGNHLHLFTCQGKPLWKCETARPLRYLAFVPESAHVVGSADFGLAACFDARGEVVWRDGVVVHVGGLAVCGTGATVLLACFSDGLHRYAINRSHPERLSATEPCRVVAVGYDGKSYLTAGMSPTVRLMDSAMAVRRELKLAGPPAAIALSPLADRCVVAVSNQVHCYGLR